MADACGRAFAGPDAETTRATRTGDVTSRELDRELGRARALPHGTRGLGARPARLTRSRSPDRSRGRLMRLLRAVRARCRGSPSLSHLARSIHSFPNETRRRFAPDTRAERAARRPRPALSPCGPSLSKPSCASASTQPAASRRRAVVVPRTRARHALFSNRAEAGVLAKRATNAARKSLFTGWKVMWRRLVLSFFSIAPFRSGFVVT